MERSLQRIERHFEPIIIWRRNSLYRLRCKRRVRRGQVGNSREMHFPEKQKSWRMEKKTAIDAVSLSSGKAFSMGRFRFRDRKANWIMPAKVKTERGKDVQACYYALKRQFRGRSNAGHIINIRRLSHKSKERLGGTRAQRFLRRLRGRLFCFPAPR